MEQLRPGLLLLGLLRHVLLTLGRPQFGLLLLGPWVAAKWPAVNLLGGFFEDGDCLVVRVLPALKASTGLPFDQPDHPFHLPIEVLPSRGCQDLFNPPFACPLDHLLEVPQRDLLGCCY